MENFETEFILVDYNIPSCFLSLSFLESII